MELSVVRRRFLSFGRDASMLWHAFRHPQTPFHLKAASALAGLYLLSPVDLIPITVPLFGVVDDLIIVPFIVGQVAKRLPDPVRDETGEKADRFVRRWMRRPLLAALVILLGLILIWAGLAYLLYRWIFG